MVKVLICGGRDYGDWRAFRREMLHFERDYGPFDTVIHGGAKGADWLAHLWAEMPIGARKEIIFVADWDAYGLAAGPIRNQRMIDEGVPDLVIAFPGGRGTADMIRRSRKDGIRVVKAER